MSACGGCKPPQLRLCNGLPTPFDLKVTCVPEGFRLTWQGYARGSVSIKRTPPPPPDNILGWLSVGTSGTLLSETWLDYYSLDPSLQPGVKYCYRIATRAVSGLYGCYTAPVCIVDDSHSSSLPSNITVQALSPREFRINWQANSTGVSAYTIERAAPGIGTYQQLAQVSVGTRQPGTNSFSFSDTQISSFEYCYRIRAEYFDGRQGHFTIPVCAVVPP